MSDYMCPNCVTPWKCNGPHIPEAVSDRPIHEVLAEISAKVPPEEWAKLDKTHYADPDTLATLAKLGRENAALRAELNDLRVRVASRDIAIGTIDDILEACAEVLGHDVVLGELPGELAALRAELEAAGSVAQEQEIVIGLIAKALKVSDEPHQGYHARVLDAAEEARKDAERYRWLLYRVGSEECNDILHGRYLRGVALNRAIDAAIAQGKGEK